MTQYRIFSAILFGISTIFLPLTAVTARDPTTPVRAVSESRYSRAHSLGEGYKFDPRDGWEPMNVTNMEYKYRRNTPSNTSGLADHMEKRTTTKNEDVSVVGAIGGVVSKVMEGLKGIGKPEPVVITWYTGHDLLNPSCWANTKWAPTDKSFAAALTMEGWTTRPKCFKFLELCHTPQKCVFVRVVDTCAGCAKGSKHVDLTRAAFGELAPYDVGILTVQLRAATEPTGWFEHLWGPKV